MNLLFALPQPYEFPADSLPLAKQTHFSNVRISEFSLVIYLLPISMS